MSEYDLNKVDKADVKFDKYVTMLQVKYGYTRQQAKTEIGNREQNMKLNTRMVPRLCDLADRGFQEIVIWIMLLTLTIQIN